MECINGIYDGVSLIPVHHFKQFCKVGENNEREVRGLIQNLGYVINDDKLPTRFSTLIKIYG